MSDPAPGTVILHDWVEPPLAAGSYRALASTTVTVDGQDHTLESERFLEVDTPRFALPPHEIAAFHPPRNGHGAFHRSLPHIVLKRRTLPWDRALAADGAPAPSPAPGETAPTGRPPWMALLVLEEGEAVVLEDVPLEEIVPAAVFQRLAAPSGVRCDALEIERSLLGALLPSVGELQLLAHARQVDPGNRALGAGDGWFSVVTASRLPRPGARHRVFLVSLEERTDLVAADPPPVADPGSVHAVDVLGGIARRRTADHIRLPRPTTARLIVLTSWAFEDGDATFAELMQRVDVRLFGVPSLGEPGPLLTDTGHVALALQDRFGTEQTVWYRSPLVPIEIARDELGPYHSADQARRVSPETGAEDVTYAAAFEIGRLLGAANGRVAAELFAWRRAAFRDAARHDNLARAAAALELAEPLAPHLARAPAPVLAVAALERMAESMAPRADAGELIDVAAPGLEAGAVAEAWSLDSPAAAEALLSPRADLIQPPRPAPPGRSSSGGDLERLGGARDALLERRRGTEDPR